jgi:hypothetical protein
MALLVRTYQTFPRDIAYDIMRLETYDVNIVSTEESSSSGRAAIAF